MPRRSLCSLDRARRPSNWQIDECQEKLIEQWARAANLWEDDSEQILTLEFGPMIAQGAEAKVYYADSNTSVVKERTSIYSTWQKALDAIVLHNSSRRYASCKCFY